MTTDPKHRIPIFLTSLRSGSPELDIGDQQFFLAFELLERLRERGETELEPRVWRNILAPVLCSSAEQQQAFAEKFDAEFADRPETEGGGNLEEPPPPPGPVVWVYAATLVALTIVGLVIYRHLPSRFEPPIIQVRPAPPNTTPPGSKSASEITLTVMDKTGPVETRVFTDGKDHVTDESGQVTLDGPAFRNSAHILVSAPDDDSIPVLLDYPQRSRNVTLDQAHTLRLPSPRIRWFTEHLSWIEAAVLVLPASLLILWLYRLWRRRRELRRWASTPDPRLRRFGLPLSGEPVFQPNDIRRLATTLRRRRPQESTELDAAATVDRTCRQGGFFSPVYAKRTSEPEYIFIGERKNFTDHQARLQDELIGRLRDHDVFVQRYYFHGDPSKCVDARGAIYPLTELGASYPGFELWLAIEAERCFDPVNSEPEYWTEMLLMWRDRVLLSGSTNLGTLPVRVTAPTRQGIEALVSNADRTSPFRYYPQMLVADPERWVTRSQPREMEIELLKTELSLFLRPGGYLLLQACAVYPALAWNITVSLAQALVISTERETTLDRLVALPWFRHGTLPDWLRVELLSDLGERELEVRVAVYEILQRAGAAAPSGEKGETLDIVLGQPDPKRLVNALDDHIYLAFALGRLDKLSVEPPTAWSKFLRDSLALRASAALLSIAMFAVLSLTFLNLLARKSLENTGAVVAITEPKDALVRRIFEVEQYREHATNDAFSDSAGFLRDAAIVDDMFAFNVLWTEDTLRKAEKQQLPMAAAPGMLVVVGRQLRMIKAEDKALRMVKLFGLPKWIPKSDLKEVYDVSGHLFDGQNVQSTDLASNNPLATPSKDIVRSSIRYADGTNKPAATQSPRGTGATMVVGGAGDLQIARIVDRKKYRASLPQLEYGIGSVHFGMSAQQVAVTLSLPDLYGDYSKLPIAGEFAPVDVRYIWVPLASAKGKSGAEALAAFDDCVNTKDPPYVAFLFENNQLFRVSARFFPTCETRITDLKQFFVNLGLEVPLAAFDTPASLTVGGTSVAWVPGVDLDQLNFSEPDAPSAKAIFGEAGRLNHSALDTKVTANEIGSGAPSLRPKQISEEPTPALAPSHIGVLGDATGAFGSKAAAPVKPVEVGTPPTSPPQPASAGLRSMLVETQPEITFKPEPTYTQEAKDHHIEGDAIVKVVFRANGNIEVLSLVRGLGYGLDEAALEAARGIRYRPALRPTGEPVDFPTNIIFHFVIND